MTNPLKRSLMAFALGSHPRLGANSPVSLLSVHLFREIQEIMQAHRELPKRIFAPLGFDGGYKHSAELFDPIKGHSQKTSPPPMTIQRFCIAKKPSSESGLKEIMIIGGEWDVTPENPRQVLLYDTENDVWSLGPPTLNQRRCSAATNTRGQYAVVTGGTSQPGNVEMLDQSDTWVFGAELNINRVEHASAELFNSVYVLGGRFTHSIGSTGDETRLKTLCERSIERWDVRDPHGWELLPETLLFPRISAGVAAVNDKLYIFGGGDQTIKCECFDPVAGKCRPIADMTLGGRTFFGTVAIYDEATESEQIWLVGGLTPNDWMFKYGLL